MSSLRTLTVALAAVAAVALSGGARAASASFGIKPGSFVAEATNEDGAQDTQAGSHPFALTTALTFNTLPEVGGLSALDGNVKDIVVGLPPGVVGDPQAVAQCSDQQLRQPGEVVEEDGNCPVDSQVGIARIQIGQYAGAYYYRPVFNMVPAEGEPAVLGIQFAFGQTHIVVLC